MLICGGTDWCEDFCSLANHNFNLHPLFFKLTSRPKLGRKERGGAAKSENNEQTSVTIVETLKLYITFFSNLQPNSHPDLLEPHILRSLSNVKAISIHASCAGCHFVVLDTDGDAWLFGRNGFSSLGVSSGDAESVSENAPTRVTAHELGAPKGTRFVHAACGRNHTLLVGSDGSVWGAGANNFGQVCCSRVLVFVFSCVLGVN